MGADSKIAWTDHTFNPWWGCVRVSPGCQHCYAETFAKRTGHDVWGVETERRMLSPGYWLAPLKWYRDAVLARERRRVFCASMADVCEDRRDLDAPREWLWELIRRTASLQRFDHDDGLVDCFGLDWLLLTKRPENLRRLVPEDILRRCWVGTTAEDQQRFDERWPHLQDCPAAVRFLSCEPQLGPITLPRFFTTINAETRPEDAARHGSFPGLGWVISGGESGPHARPYDLAWPRSLRDQCRGAGVAFFEKQIGANPIVECGPFGPPCGAEPCGDVHSIKLRDRAGSDPEEWPEDLRVREWPSSGATPR